MVRRECCGFPIFLTSREDENWFEKLGVKLRCSPGGRETTFGSSYCELTIRGSLSRRISLYNLGTHILANNQNMFYVG